MNSRILIIDDEPYNIDILRIFLTSLHYEIFIAKSGTEGLSMVDETEPDLILLDVMMPDMSGFEVCRHWMERGDFDIPIIFLSANAQKEDILEGLHLGAFDYLTKPFDLDLLERKIVFALDQKLKLKNLKEDNKLLAELVYVDALTGLYNRAYLDATIQMMNEGTRSFNAAIMVDLDRFKSINDTYGHLAGDQALKEVAAIIVSKINADSDIAFRYGGDEFLILMGEKEKSLDVACVIIDAVEELKISITPQKDLNVSVSIGVTSNLQYQSLNQLISQADSALLDAKKSGKHQIKQF